MRMATDAVVSGHYGWTLESREPFMDGTNRYFLRREGLLGIRGSLTLTPDEAGDIEERLAGRAGIVRVDTTDEALVERLGMLLESDLDDEPIWSCVVIAKHILAALREAAQ